MKPTQYPRIGILGGMGASSGVLLQDLIIRETPAKKDQDHLEVLCFTQPHIPDRTASLAEDGGGGYVAAIRDGLQVLAGGGATAIIIPCNTAYARLPELQQGCPVPILDMIGITLDSMVHNYGAGRIIGLLATDGTVLEGVYQRHEKGRVLKWIIPNPEFQAPLMKAIYDIKGGVPPASVLSHIEDAIADVGSRGAEIILLGCTELSLCFDLLSVKNAQPMVDPLRVVARHLVDTVQ